MFAKKYDWEKQGQSFSGRLTFFASNYNIKTENFYQSNF